MKKEHINKTNEFKSQDLMEEIDRLDGDLDQ
jgi:hypothetical protein